MNFLLLCVRFPSRSSESRGGRKARGVDTRYPTGSRLKLPTNRNLPVPVVLRPRQSHTCISERNHDISEHSAVPHSLPLVQGTLYRWCKASPRRISD